VLSLRGWGAASVDFERSLAVQEGPQDYAELRLNRLSFSGGQGDGLGAVNWPGVVLT
jgi:hypothetical protein